MAIVRYKVGKKRFVPNGFKIRGQVIKNGIIMVVASRIAVCWPKKPSEQL